MSDRGSGPTEAQLRGAEDRIRELEAKVRQQGMRKHLPQTDFTRLDLARKEDYLTLPKKVDAILAHCRLVGDAWRFGRRNIGI